MLCWASKKFLIHDAMPAHVPSNSGGPRIWAGRPARKDLAGKGTIDSRQRALCAMHGMHGKVVGRRGLKSYIQLKGFLDKTCTFER